MITLKYRNSQIFSTLNGCRLSDIGMSEVLSQKTTTVSGKYSRTELLLLVRKGHYCKKYLKKYLSPIQCIPKFDDNNGAKSIFTYYPNYSDSPLGPLNSTNSMKYCEKMCSHLKLTTVRLKEASDVLTTSQKVFRLTQWKLTIRGRIAYSQTQSKPHGNGLARLLSIQKSETV